MRRIYIICRMLLAIVTMVSHAKDSSPALDNAPVPSAPSIKLIAWDMGGVMVDVSILGMVRTIGPLDCVRYHLGYTSADDQLQHKIFDTLDRCCGKQRAPSYRISYHTAHRPLPDIMCRWLSGDFPELTILLDHLEQQMAHLYESGFFMNDLEYRIVRNAVRHIFDPHTLIKNTYIVKECFNLAKEVARSGLCAQTIFSNWDLQSYPALLESAVGKELQSLFDFDQAIISGTLGQLKPDYKIFRTLCRTWNLKPEEILIIDDQEENIRAAQRLGFSTIQVVDHNMKPVKMFLQQQGLIHVA